MSSTSSIAELKITLKYLKPDIWRRVRVPHDIKLSKLHLVIQTAMGWNNSHLHIFRTGTANYLPKPEKKPSVNFPDEVEERDESKYRLCDILPEKGSQCIYEYDMGDFWEHDLHIQKLTLSETPLQHAEIITGKHACPPDDCGGVPGYCDLVDILSDSKHPEHKSMRKWMGLKPKENFEPELFDLAPVRAALAKLKI